MAPQTDLEDVVNSEIKEWHFHIYFHQNNDQELRAALELRDAVLRLRRDGAFVAVPLFRVNTGPMGPHPVGSYEIWVPSTSFASVYSYLCQNRGNLSIFVHPLTKEEVYSSLIYGSFDKRLNFTPEEVRNFCHMPYIILKICSRDHEIRNAWIGPSFPLDLTKIPVTLPNVPLQYPSLKLGYSAPGPDLTLEERRRIGANLERILEGEKEAARAPPAMSD